MFAITGVLALLVVVAVLAWAAYQHTRPASAGDAAQPVPTFTLGVQAPTPTPTAEQVRREQTRFLSIGSEVWWRATAGACGGPAPVIERSTDEGATWADVTPAYLGIAQVQTLDAFSGRDAEIVAAMSGCEAQALRTYTRGEFWESYPDVLAASRYVDPTDAGSVRLSSGPVPAPCPAAAGLHAFGDVVALVCDGRAWSWSDSEWTQLPPEGAVAVGIDGSDILVGHRAEDCDGVAVSRVSVGDTESAAVLGCAAETDAAAPVAIDSAGGGVMVWAGDSLVTVGP
ncbi:hypothetical protein [Microbacterium sp. B35-04]|uniref:hypothetical protein n=1 Tax=Microbacterium sp. B35-04 TaxID=1961716 RepID=UPI0013D66BE8|nr:hypothetical protein [Microbacterium sp. B35-04]